MKKILFMMSVLASLFITGCSQEEVTPPGGEDDGGSNTSYMAVNLVSSDPLGSRAQDGYEDGSATENHVKKVRFYFFNAAGGSVDVKLLNGSYVNYWDWEPNTKDTYPDNSGVTNPDQIETGSDDDDIESKLNAIIVINTANGDKVPQRIAAVLNPPSDMPGGSQNLTDLKKIAKDYASEDYTKKGTFVMFNSVGGGGTDLSTTLIESRNLCKDETTAKANPVTIYVERSVAKVSVELGDAILSAATDKLALKDKEDNDLKVDGKQVYLKLGGWSLTAETSEGRLIKKVNKDWDGTWWYSTYRSFWAINAMTTSIHNKYFDYENISTSFGNDAAKYTNENAQLKDIDNTPCNAKNRTKVIIKGQLQDKDGNPFTIVRHLGVYFADTPDETESGNLNKLKESILNQLRASKNNFYYAIKDAGGNETGRVQIGIGDIMIVPATVDAKENSQNNCYVYAQLTDAAKGKTWYATSEGGTAIVKADEVINGILADKTIVDRALVWNSGMTYYYYEILHLRAPSTGPVTDNDTGQKGVVRNHVYKTKVTKIAGLGTPVYDPEKVIYPEKPDPNNHYIAAEIKILSWRIVSNDYALEW